jgi:acyl-coenzyme A thioesterase PaaI-like protein
VLPDGKVIGMTDLETLSAGMLGAVPFARTLGVEFTAVADGGGTVTVRLPDAERLHNHVGGPHAAAMFGLAETASGAVVMAVFADQLDRAVPLAVRADIAYRKLAMGPVEATARLERARDEVVAELDGGRRPEFTVAVDITRPDGAVAAEVRVVWTLRPHTPRRADDPDVRVRSARLTP